MKTIPPLLKPRQPKREPWTEEMFVRRRMLVLGMQLDLRTWENYSSAYNSWREFVNIHNYPLRPNVTTMSNYVMFLSDHIAVNSVVTYLSGIVMILEPYYPDVRQIRHSRIVRDTLTGCRQLRNLPTSRKSPFTISMLQQISQQSSSYHSVRR
jgi:hypothetical protein